MGNVSFIGGHIDEEFDRTIQESIYPLTITADRYSGVYSGGLFLAWNLDADEIPEGIYSDDCGCHEFWLTNEIPVGKGQTVEEAIGNLYIILKEADEDDL